MDKFILPLMLFISITILYSVAFTSEVITFTDVTDTVGINQTTPTWGISWGDVNADGWEDIYVSNHQYNEYYADIQTPPALFLNQRDGTFLNVNMEYGLIFRGD